MMAYEQDPDVVQWGLRFFESDPYADCGYIDNGGQDDAGCYSGHYVEHDHYGFQSNDIDNDELLAHALQEELSQLAVTESPASPSEASGQLQPSYFPHDWNGHSIRSYGSGQEESEDITHSSSCSSPEEKSYCVGDWPYPLELADDYAYDGEVGKRLTQMIPVPHVPKINGEIPSMDEATLDHQRLLERLQLYGLVECKVQGDGNCQFRALSDQIYRISEHHEFVRQQIVNQLKSHPDKYEGYVPMAYDEYLEKMCMNGEWGDHVTLQAAADLYGVKIFVITSFKDTCYIEILPSDQRSNRVIFLSFWAEVHYNSIYLEGEFPALKTKKKKKWTMFRNKHMETIRDYQ